MSAALPVIAGTVSTTIFAAATLPMLMKAARTRDLASYSIGNIGLANVGNLIHSVYVFSLPMGPIWLLHGFYLVSTGLMLAWWLRYARPSRRQTPQTPPVTPVVLVPSQPGESRPYANHLPRRRELMPC